MTPLPVGFRRFHRDSFLNYQLNRWFACGFADPAELSQAAQELRRVEDVVPVFSALSDRAEAEGRLRPAAAYQRAVEFFTPPFGDARVEAYRRFRDRFDRAIAGTGVERHEVPYADATLPAYRLAASGEARGTVLLLGGFDSLIEEFFPVWERIAAAGWDLVAFEGPGQGGARLLAGLRFDHDYEKPVAAVLDHFRIGEAALVGLSMGGYWALRAAGREPRITRVVAWPPVYDWMAQLPGFLRPVVRGMLRLRGFMNATIRLRMSLFPVLRHAVEHARFLVDADTPMGAVDWMLGMNAAHLGSERVTQDVLVLAGENDAFQPLRLARRQVAALTHARSVTTRVFTRAEHADQHCQMGNLDLATQVLTRWLATGGVDAA